MRKAAGLLLLCLILSGADYLGPTRVVESRVVAGIRFEVRVFSGAYPKETLKRVAVLALDEAEETMRRMDELAAVTDLSSAALGADTEADAFTFLKTALGVSRASGGAYDPSAGEAAELWSTAREQGEPPAKERIESALRSVSYQDILLDDSTRKIAFKRSGARLASRGQAAAAYAVDRMLMFMKERKVLSGYVTGGSTIRFIGLPPDGRVWRVGIDHPRRVDGYAAVLELPESAAVSSAGDYEDFFVYQGKRYANILDAKTGFPADRRIAAVNVVSKDALTAQLAAQAFCALGAEEGHRMLDKLRADQDVQAVAIEEGAQGGMQLSISDGAQPMITEVEL